MESRFRWPLLSLCYAALAGVIGGILLLVGKPNEDSGIGGALVAVGGMCLLVGIGFLLNALWGLIQALNASDADDTD